MDIKDINNLQQENEMQLKQIQATQKQLMRELERLNKLQSRVKVKTTLLVAIIAILILVTGTLAWFTLNSFASVDNLTMEITEGVDLRVDMVNHGSDIKQYKKVITNDMINSYLSTAGGNAKSLSDIKLDPLTTSTGSSPLRNQKGTEIAANGTASYIEYKAWFIASKDMWVHLSADKDTQVEPNKKYSTVVSTTETGAKADIVKAVRISYQLGQTTKIYEPNKGTPVANQSTFDLGAPGTYSNDTRLFHLTKLEPQQVTIRIWAEGNDPECDDDVQQAKLSIQMLFAGTDDNNQILN